MSYPAPVEFELKLPLDGPTCEEHIRYALSLELPFVGDAPAQDRGRLDIIASGPSSKDHRPGGDSLAVNGALRGRNPTYWAACDPQEELIQFLDDPPEETTYLLATKVHPNVFDRLVGLGRRVAVWHCDDYALPDDADPMAIIPCAVSITLCSFPLACMLGYRDIHTYGWDGCYLGGEGYAHPQKHDQTPITVTLGDRAFPTTVSWACEAEDAVARLTLDQGLYDLTAHGPGLHGAVLRHKGLAA